MMITLACVAVYLLSGAATAYSTDYAAGWRLPGRYLAVLVVLWPCVLMIYVGSLPLRGLSRRLPAADPWHHHHSDDGYTTSCCGRSLRGPGPPTVLPACTGPAKETR